MVLPGDAGPMDVVVNDQVHRDFVTDDQFHLDVVTENHVHPDVVMNDQVHPDVSDAGGSTQPGLLPNASLKSINVHPPNPLAGSSDGLASLLSPTYADCLHPVTSADKSCRCAGCSSIMHTSCLEILASKRWKTREDQPLLRRDIYCSRCRNTVLNLLPSGSMVDHEDVLQG